MGVKGLHYYIENYCPNVTRRVSIAQMAREHTRMYHRSPILAVDGMSVLHRLYKMDDLEWLFGGQWKQYVENLRLFVDRFKHAGIDPVFFFDGVVEDDKKREWINRRIEKLRDVKKIFEHIVQHGTYPDERFSQLPTSFATLIRYALTTIFGCTVINTVEDADKEIARFALNNDACFAILSQDTDYVIFDTKKPYLSVAHLKLEPLETVQYDRSTFAAHVGLDIQSLPLLACLMGNDFVQVDTLRGFHRQLAGTAGNPPSHVLVSQLSNYIMRNARGILFKNGPLIMHIASNVGIDGSTLFKGISYYTNLQETPNKMSNMARRSPEYILNMFLEKHRTCQMNPQIYALMMQQSYKSSECLEDQRSTGLMPSSIIFRGLRQRLYAIIFGDNNVEVEEISAIQDLPMLIENVKPEFFRVFGTPQPQLVQLWDMKMSSIRWKTVASAMGVEKINFQMNGSPPHYLALAILVNYLLRNPVGEPPLALWEVDALVAQTVSPLTNDIQAIRNLVVPMVEPRAVHLATIMMRGIVTFISLLQVCGGPIAVHRVMPWYFFDGKVFHYLYLMAKAGATPRQLMVEDMKAVHEFRQLRRMAIADTYMEKILAEQSG